MDLSYIGMHHICEYWGGTVVYCLSRKSIAYCDVREQERWDEEREKTELYAGGEMRYPDGTWSEVEWNLEHYDEIYQHIQPWFPSSFYFTSKSGDGMFNMVQFDHYKRSASGEVYQPTAYRMTHGRLQSTGMDVSLYRVHMWKTVDRTLQEALEISQENPSPTIALSKDFALAMGDTSPWHSALLFKDMPIGMLDKRFNIHLHPKYEDHFGRAVQRIMQGGTAYV